MSALSKLENLSGIFSTMFGVFSVTTWRRILCGLFAVLTIYMLSQLVWLFAPMPKPSTQILETSFLSPAKQQARVDVAGIQSRHLFGEYNKQAVPEEVIQPVEEDPSEDAEQTKLSLILNGIIYSSVPELGMAIIKHNGKDQEFKVGDNLPISGVTLAKVFADYVIINNRGKRESLWLFDENSFKKQKNRRTTSRATTSNNRTSEIASNYRERLYKNPASLAQAINIIPAQANGQLVGYKIMPGADREQFKALGFENGDIIKSINGIQLDNPSKALELYRIMRTAESATFTIERNGSSMEKVVSFN